MHLTATQVRRALRQAVGRAARRHVSPAPCALRGFTTVTPSSSAHAISAGNDLDHAGAERPERKASTSSKGFNLLGAAAPRPLFERGNGASAAAASESDDKASRTPHQDPHRRKFPGKWWKQMDRASFRKLLSNGMNSSTVSSVLRKYMDEYPILDNHWTDQELVMIVSTLIKMNRNEIALEVLRNQIQDANRERLNRVAAMSARLGNAQVALGVLDIAKHFNLAPDVVTYTSAIHACARGGYNDLPMALNLLNEMITSGVQPNARTYGAAVLAYARLQSWEEIEELINSIMYTEETRKVDVFASAIITCSRNRQYEYAARLFDVLVEDGVYPGDNVCNSALSACGRTSDLKRLRRIFNIVEQHAKPTIYTFNCMISAFGNAGKMDDALQVFKSMQEEHNVAPDVVTFNALLLSAVRSRRTHLIPFILSLMSDAGAKWDQYTLNMLLEGCALTGDVERAERYWAQANPPKMASSNQSPREVVQSPDEEVQHDQPEMEGQDVHLEEEAQDVQSEVEVQNVYLDRTHFETLMSVYFAAKDYAAVVSLWQDNYTCRRRAKSAKTLNFLICACEGLKDDEKAITLLAEFVERGQPVSAVTHNHMLAVFLAADKYSDAFEYLQKMREVDGQASTFSFTLLMKYLLKHQRYTEVVSMLDLYLGTVKSLSWWQNPLLHYPPDAIYVLATHAAAAMHDHETVLGIYDELPATMSTAVKEELLAQVIASCDREDDWRAAVTLFDEMTGQLEEDSNLELYKQVVKIVARAGEFDRALDVGGGKWYRRNRPDQGWGN
ncbi:hypothetical protein BBJ28_00013215 [Nothophytophthora sp. Chile5]|nr:hypothetical protein BBJ28_00013215 [Nothophytophthora sp. Chile5]